MELFITKEYFEDYAIGFNLDQRFKTDMLNISTNMFFMDMETCDY